MSRVKVTGLNCSTDCGWLFWHHKKAFGHRKPPQLNTNDQGPGSSYSIQHADRGISVGDYIGLNKGEGSRAQMRVVRH